MLNLTPGASSNQVSQNVHCSQLGGCGGVMLVYSGGRYPEGIKSSSTHPRSQFKLINFKNFYSNHRTKFVRPIFLLNCLSLFLVSARALVSAILSSGLLAGLAQAFLGVPIKYPGLAAALNILNAFLQFLLYVSICGYTYSSSSLRKEKCTEGNYASFCCCIGSPCSRTDVLRLQHRAVFHSRPDSKTAHLHDQCFLYLLRRFLFYCLPLQARYDNSSKEDGWRY